MNMKLLVGGVIYFWVWVKGFLNEVFGVYMLKFLVFV